MVATGERVLRERALPSAVLTRVAASHLRVGTFQYAAASGDRDLLRALAGYAIARHYPEAAGGQNRYLDLYRRVVGAQASLVARWMLVRSTQSVRAAFAVAEMIMRPNRRQWADLTVRWKPAAPSALSRSPATPHR